MGHFRFPCFDPRISFVTSTEIDDFLRGLKGKDKDGKEKIVLSGKSRNNYRRAIGTLFNFAVARGYLPKGAVEVEDVAMAREENGEIEIFRPEELANLLIVATCRA